MPNDIISCSRTSSAELVLDRCFKCKEKLLFFVPLVKFMFKPVTPSAKHSNLPVDNQEIISANLAIIWLTRFFVVPSSSKQLESVNWLQVCPNNKDSSNLILTTTGGNMKPRFRWFRRVMAFAFLFQMPQNRKISFSVPFTCNLGLSYFLLYSR